MSFKDEFEVILFNGWRGFGYIFGKVFWNLFLFFASVFIVTLLYYRFGEIIFSVFLVAFLFYMVASSFERLGRFLRSADLHVDVMVSIVSTSALVFELIGFSVFLLLWVYYFEFPVSPVFVSIVFLYGSGAFILSLLNLKPHLMAKLMPFSDQVASHFLELPRLEVKEVRGVGERERYLFEERRGFGERVEFERIELPIVPRVGLSFVNLFKLLSLPFLLLLIFILSLFLRNFEFLVDLGLVGVVLVVFVWYFVYMLVSLDREEQVYSTSLVLSVLVIVSSFIVVYYLVGVHLAGANSFDVGFLRLQFVVSGLVALSSALVVVELPGYLVLSGIKERKIESLRADIDKLNRELDRLLSELEAYSHSSGREGIARVNVLREHIRITMSKKSFLEEEIIRVENESSSPVPLLDKVLSGGLLGLIVALFTILAG